MAITRAKRRRLLFERLEDRKMLASDFGDAPEFYPTTIAENGARHVATRPMLGATRDTEVDGSHSSTANSDDNNGTDDEDGVTFGTIRVGQLDAVVTVNVQGGPARLDAWIDFNKDGSLGGPWEQVADNVLVTTGDNTIEFDVPSWAVSGETFGRFRISTAGNLRVRGEATDGEVEDYVVTIVPPIAGSASFSAGKTITTEADGAVSVYSADVDGDGDMDLLAASVFEGEFAWFENDGRQSFTKHVIDGNLTTPTTILASDLDSDGDIDVFAYYEYESITTIGTFGTIVWYENDGQQVFKRHEISDSNWAGSRLFVAALKII